jgi:hypothetical protein
LYFGSFPSIVISRYVETLGSRCFSSCRSLSSISFESDSQFKCIASKAFYESSVKSIVIPRYVEIFDSKCFSSCYSLSSI